MLARPVCPRWIIAWAISGPIPGQKNHEVPKHWSACPAVFNCYHPPPDAPEVGPPPALSNGYITFGSCNHLPKVNPSVIQLWSRLLQEVPRSRLILRAQSFADAEIQDRYRNFFVQQGLSGDRLEFHPAHRELSRSLGAVSKHRHHARHVPLCRLDHQL